ncbi:MAG: galactose-1-phosphate uridylyltransferase [Nitrososphaerota archaeon]|jgi:UDPglucose--hexose-1-phosphate uridylyltransferase|nr:galactose-1-phosphate uridylyltransferase [Nitrososphaerota archaeon]MDG6957909.1 galactose-1-phosphate uridylyltransferase [Nitrososphaerota archaeon]MDG6959341.1 galactose-1-phosphate uridylyltransferase [Nitrososphaerota archaeon]MDG6961533.1 galactose-1-phosphate uridylyltransferase [Nitrososphaerota archaeon]MDG7015193.1 galactose-1-phosphate uridylyltransferase [Nitrososphaerota archaeon]
MVEIRKDYFTEKLSIILPDRGLRPGQVIPQKPEKCNYCAGNEEMTPPADLVLVKRGDTLLKQTDSEGDVVKNWSVRIFPAKAPLVTPGAPPSYGESPHYSEPAAGYHYVLVATPRHDLPFSKIDIEQWTNILASLQDKVRWLYSQKGVSYVLVYVNSEKDGTPTAVHPSLQLVTTPRVPPAVEVEAVTVQTSLNDLGICPMCQVVTAETGGPRQILATDFFLAFAPWVSTHPFEFWVYPKRHMTSILKLSQKEMMDLALMLRSTLGGLSKALDSPSFTMVFHSSSEKKTTKQIHWHIEVFPKRERWTGLELGGGIYANEVSPEAAAQALGASSRKELAQLVGIK